LALTAAALLFPFIALLTTSLLTTLTAALLAATLLAATLLTTTLICFTIVCHIHPPLFVLFFDTSFV
jgi:hypothetical protein